MIFESWLIVVNVRLKPCEFAVFSGAALHRKGAAKTPCKCGSLAGFLTCAPFDAALPRVAALGHVRVYRGIGRGNAAIAVCRGICGGARLDAPVLRAAAEVGESGLQTAAMLVVRRLGRRAAGDGQRRAEVGNTAAVGDDGRERVVDDLADGLRGGDVVPSERVEEGGAVRGVVEYRGADAGGVAEISSHKKLPF